MLVVAVAVAMNVACLPNRDAISGVLLFCANIVGASGHVRFPAMPPSVLEYLASSSPCGPTNRASSYRNNAHLVVISPSNRRQTPAHPPLSVAVFPRAFMHWSNAQTATPSSPTFSPTTHKMCVSTRGSPLCIIDIKPQRLLCSPETHYC